MPQFIIQTTVVMTALFVTAVSNVQAQYQPVHNQPVPQHIVHEGYPQLNAPLYPSPVQQVPHQIGGTVVTNPAFAPHEMLYPHTYRALYPPFYHKVRGTWFVWPWGVETREQWKLQGTEVKVEYRSSRPFLSGFGRFWSH